ncbi:hypothetical protein JYK14_13105 [Siccirubricoccus sp. KC 17139]|uniref:Alpha/beta hydrolase n=1 Tax=Siccirubricoccus soli TaxID=2899147 RepID=A0ABT1D677_9PROT|nr:hypothetical protein [Siccirubricoccus soli]MCO6417092.1 hypothetical protein [Siccirubricoccus soli]MCP2683227.1 hypothetical protein [Siccirubricoccus soli]
MRCVPLALAICGCLLLPARPGAEPVTRTEPLWLEGPAFLGPGASLPFLLTLPAGWTTGDAAVILVGPGTDAWQEQLRDALTGAEAAVLELEPGGRPSERVLPLILAALRELSWQAGAGLVIALGWGEAAEAVLWAAQEEQAARHLDPGGPRLAAAIVLGPGDAQFVPGTPPAPRQRWGVRSALLCRLLAETLEEAALYPGCVGALLHPVAGGKSLVR